MSDSLAQQIKLKAIADMLMNDAKKFNEFMEVFNTGFSSLSESDRIEMQPYIQAYSGPINRYSNELKAIFAGAVKISGPIEGENVEEWMMKNEVNFNLGSKGKYSREELINYMKIYWNVNYPGLPKNELGNESVKVAESGSNEDLKAVKVEAIDESEVGANQID